MSVSTPDGALNAVAAWFLAKADMSKVFGESLRRSLDEVIDCQRTGRYRVEQLEKTEKTYIGTKVEIVLRFAFELPRGDSLDNLIAGHEVDTKFSLTSQWMIPREAVDQLCLVIGADDTSGTFSAGLIRASLSVLTQGANQDKKRTLKAAGKQHIQWLVQNGRLPQNFLLSLTDEMRRAVLSPRSGKQRLLALFEHVNDRLIPRSVLLQVAQLKGDPLRRAREAKQILASRGFRVLCATYEGERAEIVSRGHLNPASDDWLSVRL
jgi:hypothetical protein